MPELDRLQEDIDALLKNAVDTVRERDPSDERRTKLTQVERHYLAQRTSSIQENETLVMTIVEADEDLWPMRMYLADVYLQQGNIDGFERQVEACLKRAKESFVAIALFTMMTRLYVLRCDDINLAVTYVRATMEQSPSVASYIRSIYIQTLLEQGDFQEAYRQLKLAVEEGNSMLTIEALEILPILLVQLEAYTDANEVTKHLVRYFEQHVAVDALDTWIQNVMADVAAREQLGDVRAASFLFDLAKQVDKDHPNVAGYLSIGVHMPKGWWPIQ